MQDRPLKVAKIHQPDKAVIEILEKLLESAKTGEIQVIAVSALNFDGSWVQAKAGLDKCPINSLIGAIDSLKFDILLKNVER